MARAASASSPDLEVPQPPACDRGVVAEGGAALPLEVVPDAEVVEVVMGFEFEPEEPPVVALPEDEAAPDEDDALPLAEPDAAAVEVAEAPAAQPQPPSVGGAVDPPVAQSGSG